MQTIHQSYRSMRLFLDLNWDRALYLATIAAALWADSMICSVLE
jgi:hypothetical protein